MPIILRTDELQPGMRLRHALTSYGRIMLPADKILTQRDIRAVQHRFPNACLTVRDPILDDMISFEDDDRDRTVATQAKQKIVQAMRHVQERFNSRTDVRHINFKAIQDSVMEVMAYITDNPVSSALINQTLKTEGYLSEHIGNVFYLSLVLGGTVRDYIVQERLRQTHAGNMTSEQAMDLKSLGLGVMFMDLGLYPLQNLFLKTDPLTPEEIRQFQDHPNVSADLLPDSVAATARMLVRTHHENYLGEGYPRKIPGCMQHIFCRLVRICDAFTAATASHVFPQARSTAKALWEMSVGPRKAFYDPTLMKVFRSLIQPFPIGAKIKLNDGRYAVVVRYNHRNSFLPCVMIVFDEHNQRIPAERLESPFYLNDQMALRLAEFDAEKLDFLYQENLFPTDEPEVPPMTCAYAGMVP